MGRRARRVPGARVWSAEELLIVVQPRDQRALRVLQVDPATGATTLVHEDTDPHWVEIVPGVPARTASGALLWITDAGTRAGCSSTASRSPRRPCRSAPCSTSTGTPCCSARPRTRSRVALWTWSAADGLARASPRSPACTAGGWAAATLVVSRAVARRRRHARPPSARRGGDRARRSPRSPSRPGWARGSPAPRPASGRCAPRCCCRRGTSPGTPLPVLHGPLRRPARPARRRRPRRAT